MLEILFIIIILILVTIVLLLFVEMKKGKKKYYSKSDEYELIEKLEEEKPKIEVEPKVKKTEIKKVEEPIAVEESLPSEKPKTAEKPKIIRHKKEVPKDLEITKDSFKRFKGTKILLAEDNLINQKVIMGLLKDSGIELTIANDGQEALDILEKNSYFKIILMDSHMPKMDGIEAAIKIRENKKYDNILIISHSGDVANDDLHKMEAAGMEEHLPKPLSMVDLYKILYAYEDVKNTKIDEQDSKLKTLDTDKGLILCGNDKDFYSEILNDFVSRYYSSIEKLKVLFKNEDYEESDKLLFDISALTANIGAIALHAVVLNLRESLHNKNYQKYHSQLNDYKKHLITLVEEIRAFK